MEGTTIFIHRFKCKDEGTPSYDHTMSLIAYVFLKLQTAKDVVT